MSQTIAAVRSPSEPSDLGRVRRALDAVASGRPVVVVDGEDRAGEGDLIVAAELVTPATMAFLVRHTSGFVCVALPGADCDRLDLSPMRPGSSDGDGGDAYRTAWTVTVDATRGVSTGISARDRAHTARTLADPAAEPGDLTRPGHVVGLRARDRGVLSRRGHAEAAVDLAGMAGLRPAGVVCEVVSTWYPGRMARGLELAGFAREHGLVMVSIAELAAYRLRTEPRVERAAEASLPTTSGPYRVVGYRDLHHGGEHVALVCGEVSSGRPVAVRVHQECLVGDALGSLLCGCRARLAADLDEVAAAGCGVVVYLRDPGPGVRRALLHAVGQPARPGRCPVATDGPIGAPGLPGVVDGAVDAILGDLGVTAAESGISCGEDPQALAAPSPPVAAAAAAS